MQRVVGLTLAALSIFAMACTSSEPEASGSATGAATTDVDSQILLIMNDMTEANLRTLFGIAERPLRALIDRRDGDPTDYADDIQFASKEEVIGIDGVGEGTWNSVAAWLETHPDHRFQEVKGYIEARHGRFIDPMKVTTYAYPIDGTTFGVPQDFAFSARHLLLDTESHKLWFSLLVDTLPDTMTGADGKNYFVVAVDSTVTADPEIYTKGGRLDTTNAGVTDRSRTITIDLEVALDRVTVHPVGTCDGETGSAPGGQCTAQGDAGYCFGGRKVIVRCADWGLECGRDRHDSYSVCN